MACDSSDDPCAFVDGVTAMSDKMIPSAFPLLPPVDDNGQSAFGYPFPDPGMTLRDYFAAKAMQALLQNPKYGGIIGVNNFSSERAKESYEMADAMLKAREQ